MSTIECNLASGDGVKPVWQGIKDKRAPVPSCRRFATKQQHKSKTNKKKIQEALQQITTTPESSPQFNRKRAQTMAEITPSKKKNMELKFIGDTYVKPPPKKSEASQRIYQQLLLNAWRRRRSQVAALSDSSHKLREQVSQLQMQVSLLQELRKSESLKRTEAVKETQQLKKDMEGLQVTVDQLKMEKAQLNEEVERLQQKIEQLAADGENLKNEQLTSKSEISAHESRLAKDKEKILKLLREKENLTEKVAFYEELSADQVDTIYNLRRSLDSSEGNLSTANINAGFLEEEKNELSCKLQKEFNLRDELQKQYIEKKNKEEILEQKISDLQKNISILRETNKRLLEDNTILKQTLEEVETTFKKEKEKKWWKNAAGAVLESLRIVAHVMLPALPHKTNSYDLTSLTQQKETTKKPFTSFTPSDFHLNKAQI